LRGRQKKAPTIGGKKPLERPYNAKGKRMAQTNCQREGGQPHELNVKAIPPGADNASRITELLKNYPTRWGLTRPSIHRRGKKALVKGKNNATFWEPGIPGKSQRTPA